MAAITNGDAPILLCRFTPADSIVGGLCHYFGQDYAIASRDGRDYGIICHRDYAIIGLRGVVVGA